MWPSTMVVRRAQSRKIKAATGLEAHGGVADVAGLGPIMREHKKTRPEKSDRV